MKPQIAVILILLAGCTGLPPAQMRERPVAATWTVKTEPDLTARCIARDIETEFYSDGARTAIHPGATPGELEVFHYAARDAMLFRWEDLVAIFTVQPYEGGAKIAYRQSPDSWYRERVFRATQNWKCAK